MDEESDITKDVRQGSGDGKSGTEKVKEAGKKVKDTGKKLKNTAKKAKAGGKGAKFLLKILSSPVTWWIIVAIIIILLIIGAASFFLTMPGMMLDKITEFTKKAFGDFLAFFNGGTVSEHVSMEDQVELAQYLEDLGYDIDGYGFGHAVRDENDDITEIYYDEKTVDYLKQYLVANDATYTKTGFSVAGFFTSEWMNFSNYFGVSSKSQWSEGMLVFEEHNWNMEINKENKTLTVTSSIWWR